MDNTWLVKFLPNNIQTMACDSVVESAFEWVDWCAAAQNFNCPAVVEENEADNLWNTAWLQEPLSSIIANQEIIYNYLQDSFANINKSISDLQSSYASHWADEWFVDEKEAQRLQLQAQIEALQNEMNNL